MRVLRVLRAFLLRDLRTELSYRSGVLVLVAGGLLTVTILYFVGRSFRTVAGSYLEGYGGSYFAFAVIGVALTAYMSYGITSVAGHLRDGQASGSLEVVVLTPTRLPVLLLGASLPGYALGAAGFAVSLGAAAALGVDLRSAGVPVALLGLGLGIASFVGLGLLAAALVFVTRRGNPVSWGIRAGSVLLCGVFFPVSLLPDPLWALGQALPLTHAIEVLRRSLLAGEGMAVLWQEVLALAVLTALVVAAGVVLCRVAVRVARTDGSLSH